MQCACGPLLTRIHLACAHAAGWHGSFFVCAEILSWLQDLLRMEAHVLDGAHFLLETHPAECAELIVDFVYRDKP